VWLRRSQLLLQVSSSCTVFICILFSSLLFLQFWPLSVSSDLASVSLFRIYFSDKKCKVLQRTNVIYSVTLYSLHRPLLSPDPSFFSYLASSFLPWLSSESAPVGSFSFLLFNRPFENVSLKVHHFFTYCLLSESRDSSVDIATGYVLDVRGLISDRGKIFFSSPITSIPALGPHIQLVQGVKRPRREADPSHLVPRSRMVELYFHFPIWLHDEVLNDAQGKLYLIFRLCFIGSLRNSITFTHFPREEVVLQRAIVSPQCFLLTSLYLIDSFRITISSNYSPLENAPVNGYCFLIPPPPSPIRLKRL
jgi:hypothetical protein